MDAFVERFEAVLGSMSEEDFERHRRAVESALLEAETRLDERTGRYWTEIQRERYEFDSRERFLEAVRAITREELLAAWREVVLAPETARGVVVAVSAGEPPDDADPLLLGARPIADVAAFKRELCGTSAGSERSFPGARPSGITGSHPARALPARSATGGLEARNPRS